MIRKYAVGIAVGALCLSAFGVIYTSIAASIFASPNPVKIFNSNRRTFELIANRVMNGVHVEGTDYQAADSQLGKAGVSNIRKRGKCLGFYLASMAPDSNYEILYAPDGYSDLPIHEAAGPPNKLLELKQIDDSYHWYYWIVY
jgi:hypothetical protein